MADAIALKNLTKTFGETVAVKDLDLTVPEGALCGVIGPNGAGKTTTIRMILSILFPDQGEMTILGESSALKAKDRIGYLPEERGLYKKMKLGDFLMFMANLKGLEGSGVKKRIRALLERVELGAVEMKRCEELSKGMQQKAQFIASIIHKPDLLILDEPFSGLDPINQRLLRDLIVDENKRGATVLFSTHIMIHAEQLCDKVVMINKGEKVLDDTIAGIRARFDPRRILFEPMDPDADVGVIGALNGVHSIKRDGSAWDVLLEEGANPAAVIRAAVGALTPARIELRRPTLEDIFIAIVEGGTDGDNDQQMQLRASLQEGGRSMEVRR
jgi:ABC-2 type transport system ATP-binding protein